MASIRNARPSPVAVMLKEYEALRAEIIVALSHRLQIWSFGSTAVAALIAGALTADDTAVWPMVMAFIVPTLCVAIYRTWLTEVGRGRRASWYLWGLERRVNAKLGVRVLSWEEQLRSPRNPQMVLLRGHFLLTLLFFGVTAAASAATGARALLKAQPGMQGWLLWATAMLWGLLAFAPCVLWHRQQKVDCKQWETESAEGWPGPIPLTGQHAAASTPAGGMPQMAAVG
jgi:hypothetical protein